MSAVPQRQPVGVKKAKTMSIGVVLKQLHEEFPDVTESKLRFWESEGLITPQRTDSGYRRYTDSDVERLRYILTTQRDNYLPLKVIRQQLEAMDSGNVTPLVAAKDAEPMVTAERFRKPVHRRLTDNDVAQHAGITTHDVEQLRSLGLIVPDRSGFFTADDANIATTVKSLREFGFGSHHLKRLLNAAKRQADLISQATQPIAQAKDNDAQQRAEETAQNISALVVSLHATLVKNALREG